MTAAESPAVEGLSRLWKVLGQLVAPTTLVTVLLVYFSWVRTSVIYDVFGVSHSTLGLTVDDLLLRSSTTFNPVALVLFLIVLVGPVHRLVLRSLRVGAGAWLVPRLASAIGVLAVGVGVLGFTRIVEYQVGWPLVPMSIGVGLMLIGYGNVLRGAVRPEPPNPPAPDPLGSVQRVAFAAVALLTAFWSLAVFAQLNGYRLLLRSDEKYFLLPLHWRPGAHAAVLADDSAVRLEFFR
jgi:hypothetical protein